jgi:tripeptidyl-peptidase-1
VGATQVGRNKTVHDPEEAVSLSEARFLSGGGFSIVYDAPAYQKEAIAKYFATSNTSLPYFFNGSYNGTDGVYNRNGRGVPDVSAG